MPVNRWIVPIVAVAILLGSMAIARPLGWWQTSGSALTSLADATPDDIRGSTSLAELSSAFSIPTDELLALLSLPADTPAAAKLKDLEEYNEVSTVRGLVAEHLGLPWEWDEEHTAEETPTTAAPVTEPVVAVTPEAAPTEQEHTGPTPLSEAESASVDDIRGSSTLADISDTFGVPLSVLYEELDLGEDIAADTALKDIKAAIPEFEVSVVRDVVEAYLAQ